MPHARGWSAAAALLWALCLAGQPGLSEAACEDGQCRADEEVSALQLSRAPNASAKAGDCPWKHPRPFKNIGILGRGYDIIRGNPHDRSGTGADPGIKRVVVSTEAQTQHRLTPDRCHTLPDSVAHATDDPSCSFEASVRDIKGAHSMQVALNMTAKVSGNFAVGSFTASAGFQAAFGESNKFHHTYTSAAATCSSWNGALKLEPDFPTISDDFRKIVEALPESQDVSAQSGNKYWDLIDNFGTHYISSVVMGSKYGIQSDNSQTSEAQYRNMNINVNYAAKTSFMIKMGVEYHTDAEIKQAKEFEEKRYDMHAWSIGASPPFKNNIDQWIKDSGVNPAPLAYDLTEISTLLTEAQFKKDMTAKRKTLETHLGQYCKQVAGCNPHPEDDPVVDFAQENQSFREQTTMTCTDAGSVALSCGLKWETYPANRSAASEKWSIHPSLERREACTSSVGYFHFADIYMNCVNKEVADITVQSTRPQDMRNRGYSRAECPAGTKVVGCGVSAREKGDSGGHWWMSAMPTDQDGTGCTCYFRKGSDCYATCATNLGKYKVVPNTAKSGGEVVVECPHDWLALGCGIDRQPPSGPDGGADSYWQSGPKTCTCRSDKPLTCYAMCGLFQAP